MFASYYKKAAVIGASIVGVAAIAGVAGATHSWGNYHWARMANPFMLKLGDNVSATWDTHLTTASGDWSVSSVLDTTIVAGSNLRNQKSCKPKAGRVEVCNSKYGFNGWLGVAQIWISGSHITQGTTKLNDTYFDTATYNTPAWRQFVICQEIGHTFGLDHQNEVFDDPNLGSCMDYTNNPSTNQHPNQHDYDQLALIYGHFDAFTTVGQTVSHGKPSSESGAEHSEWGREIRTSSDGRGSLYERDLGGGNKVLTFVIWAR